VNLLYKKIDEGDLFLEKMILDAHKKLEQGNSAHGLAWKTANSFYQEQYMRKHQNMTLILQQQQVEDKTTEKEMQKLQDELLAL